MNCLHPSLPPFIMSAPSSTPLLRSPANTRVLFKSQQGFGSEATWASPTGAKRVKDKDKATINKCFHFLFEDGCVIFPYQKVKVPAVLLLTQSKHRAGGGTRMKGTGALHVDSEKNLQCGERRLISADILCVCARVGELVHAPNRSLYFPARTVHHNPPPASATILQFLTSSHISHFHSSC